MENDEKATVNVPASKTIEVGGKIVLVAAGSELSRTKEVTKAGSFQGIESTKGNRYLLYQQMDQMSPHISLPLSKLSFGLVKGLRFESGDKENPDKELQKEFEAWGERIQIRMKVQSITRLLVRDGTFVGQILNIDKAVYTPDPKGTPVDEFDFEPVMMQYATMIPKGVTPGQKPETVVTGRPIKAFIKEENENERQEIKNFIYMSLFPYDKIVKDNMGRETYGIYGKSLLECLHDILMKYLDIVGGYSAFVKKYGLGRYWINYKVLEEVLKEGDVETVKKVIDEMKAVHQYIEENEDIVGCGFEIKELGQGGSNLDVVGFKESLETDLHVGLLQQPLTMGKAEGTTYAAGYVSEADRLVVLEGLQKLIQDFVNVQIINRRLVALGKEPGSIKVIFEELSQPSIVFKDLLAAYIEGAISRKELRLRGVGLPPEVSKEDMEEGREFMKSGGSAMPAKTTESPESNEPKAPDTTPSIT